MYLSTLAGEESGILLCINAKRFFNKAVFTLFFFLFIVQFNSWAQTRPSCSVSGPVKAKVQGEDIIVDVHIANSTAQPQLKYLLTNNGSHATIRARGLLVYNKSTNSATQQLIISPGDTPSGFNLEITATTPNGTGRCSKSVSVSN